MSRTVTPPQPAKTASPSTVHVPLEMIAKRAYDKWCKRGKPAGTDKQDWYEAEAELRGEIARSASTSSHGQRR